MRSPAPAASLSFDLTRLDHVPYSTVYDVNHRRPVKFQYVTFNVDDVFRRKPSRSLSLGEVSRAVSLLLSPDAWRLELHFRERGTGQPTLVRLP